MATRRYESRLRAEQSERTREQILGVAHEMLAKEGVSGLSLPRVATQAGVSIPTVYRYFPTVDDLLRATVDWLRPRLGLSRERLASTDLDALPELPLENFPRYEEHGPLLLRLMESAEWHRIRSKNPSAAKEEIASILRAKAPKWSLADVEAGAAVIYLLASTPAWRWLRESWGLDAEDAARASSWAMGVLLQAMTDGHELPKRKKHHKEKKR